MTPGTALRLRGLEQLRRTGWLQQARRCPSPNCDERPPGTTIDLLVIHNISLPPGEFGGDWIDRFFCNRLEPAAHTYFAAIANLRVSAHLLIRRNGELVQYVPFQLRAWHAGESAFQGRCRCNDYSIGIELEGTDDRAFTRLQYQKLIKISGLLLQAYPAISVERITGHSEIAPGRKSDPGPAFAWQDFHRGLRQRLAAIGPTADETRNL